MGVVGVGVVWVCMVAWWRGFWWWGVSRGGNGEDIKLEVEVRMAASSVADLVKMSESRNVLVGGGGAGGGDCSMGVRVSAGRGGDAECSMGVSTAVV